MSHGPSREVMHVRQQLWCDACTATLKPFRLAVPFAELRAFLVVSGVSACRRSGVMSRQCCFCMATRDLDQFPQRDGGRCRRCHSATDRMRRLAGQSGYLMSFLATMRDDRHFHHLLHAFVEEPDFTFRSYYGTDHSDDAIRARRARRAENPPTSQPGSPPSSPSGQNGFGPMRVRVRIDASGPFSATISGEHRAKSGGRASSPTS